jgi:hypothetical protein
MASVGFSSAQFSALWEALRGLPGHCQRLHKLMAESHVAVQICSITSDRAVQGFKRPSSAR